MLRPLAALVVTTLLAGTAGAADLSVRTPPAMSYGPSPVFVWTGFYLGANAGYVWGDVDVGGVTVDGDPAAYGGSNFKPDGFLFGGQIGYNYQFQNNVVLGIEADFQGDDVNDTNNLNDRAKLSSFGTVRGRLGYAFDHFLPYATAGVAVGKVKGTLVYDDGATQLTDSQTHWGWVVGGGLECAWTSNWTTKLEYLYYDLGDETYQWTHPDFGPISADIGPSGSLLRLGVNYKF